MNEAKITLALEMLKIDNESKITLLTEANGIRSIRYKEIKEELANLERSNPESAAERIRQLEKDKGDLRSKIEKTAKATAKRCGYRAIEDRTKLIDDLTKALNDEEEAKLYAHIVPRAPSALVETNSNPSDEPVMRTNDLPTYLCEPSTSKPNR